jgi:hypothetical protein
MLKADRDAAATTRHVLVGRLTVEAGGDSAHSRRSSSGSLAMLAAMRLASSRVRRRAAERRPGSSSK